MCVCVYVYVCMCVCVYACMCVCVYVHVYVCMLYVQVSSNHRRRDLRLLRWLVAMKSDQQLFSTMVRSIRKRKAGSHQRDHR